MNPRVADALRFWEQRRLIYNVVLTLVFIGWVVVSWPYFQGKFSFVHVAQLAVLAVIANALYCSAYLVELFFGAAAASKWQHWRWTVWTVGMLVAILVESYWVNDEMMAPLIH